MPISLDSRRHLPGVTAPFGSVPYLRTENEEMRHCLEVARLAGVTEAPVLLAGEPGVGKTLLAGAIHFASGRRGHPCLLVDCPAAKATGFVVREFGDAPAPGGEATDRLVPAGKVALDALTPNGTLILKTLGWLPRDMQAELLAFFETGAEPARPRPRLVATTQGEMAEQAARGFFGAELLYCLSEITIRVPPLRRRPEDVAFLAESAIGVANRQHGKDVKGLSASAMDLVRHYPFPGNVRQFFLIIGKAVAKSSHDLIYIEDLELPEEDPEADGRSISGATLMPLFEVERRHIDRALLRSGWKKRTAARLLGLSLVQLERKIEIYGLESGTR